ncbi:MAG: glycosyltransferase family 39 protein [Lishizhenia sp.]
MIPFFKHNFGILIFCLFYFVSGLTFISFNAIAGDEPFSIYFSGQPYSKIWTELFTGNNPPLYEIFLKTISTLFGKSVVVFRLPSLLFATATLYLFYQFLKKRFSYQAAIFFGFMYCFSDYFITFSLEARGYSMLNFLICISVVLFFKGYTEHKKSAKIALVIINCLLLLTHYLSALFICVQVLAILLSPEIKSKIKTIFTYYGLNALIMSPLLLNIILRIKDQNNKTTWLGPPEGITDIYNNIWRFSNKPVIAVLIIALIILIPLLKIWKNKSIRIPGKYIFFILWFPLLFLSMYLLSFQVPMFIDRYLMILSLGFYGTIAILLTKVFQSEIKNWIFGFSLVLLFGITHRWVIDNKRPLDKIAEWIKTNHSQETQVVLSDYQMLHGIAYHTDKTNFFASNQKSSNVHLTECLSAQNIGFDFNAAPKLLIVEQGKGLQPRIQEKIEKGNYTLINEEFLPEIYTLKTLINSEKDSKSLYSK